MNKPQNLKEYVLTLRKFNPTISDVNLTLYLSSLGYSPEEIMEAFVEGEPRLTSGTDDLELEAPKKEVVETSLPVPPPASFIPPAVVATAPPVAPVVFEPVPTPTPVSIPVPEPIKITLEGQVSTPVSVVPTPPPKKIEVTPISTAIHAPVFVPSLNPKPFPRYEEPNFTSPSDRKESPHFVSSTPVPQAVPPQNLETPKSPFAYPNRADENFHSAFVPQSLDGKVFPPKNLNSFEVGESVPVKKGGFVFSKIFSTFFVLLFLAGLAYGYFEYVDGVYVRAKAPYEKETVFADAILKISKVPSLSVKSDIGFSITNKEVGTALFDVRKYNNSEYESLVRDEGRFKDLSDISTKVSSFFTLNKKYPTSLNFIEAPVLDPSGKPYQYKSALVNKVPTFTLPVDFETFEGALASKGYATTVVEKRALFTDKHMPPFYALPIVPKTYIFADAFTTLGGELSSLPLDSDFSLLVNGFLKNLSGDVEGQLSFTTSFKGGEFDLSGGAEIAKIKNDSFTKFKGLSFLFFENSKLDDKWVKINKDQIPNDVNFKNYAGAVFSNDVSSMREQLKTILKIAGEENLFFAEAEPKRMIEKFDVFYSYSLLLNKKAVPAFYERAGKALSEKFKEKALFGYDETTKRQIQDKMFSEFLDFVSKNQKFTLVVDKDGVINFIDFGFVLPIVSPEQNIYKQANFSMKTNFGSFGKEVVIEVPLEFIEANQALEILNGS
jgi:hypothetical protein